MGSQNRNLGQKKHISMIAVIVFIADYFFFSGHFGNMQIS